MHKNARRNLARLATTLDSPFALAVKAGLNDGSEEAFRSALEAAGYKIVDTTLKVRHQAEVFDPQGACVARGISDSPEDALLQAVHGCLKELEQSLSKE